MDRDHFSNLSFPCPKEAPHEIWATFAKRLQRRYCLKFSTFFPYKCMVPIQMHREAKFDLTIKRSNVKVKRQCTIIILATLVDLSSPCKNSAPKHPRFWRRRFLKVFTIYGHRSHLGKRRVTILTIVPSPNLRGLHMKFERNRLSGFRGGHLKVLTDRRRDNKPKVITIAHPEHSLGELKNPKITKY